MANSTLNDLSDVTKIVTKPIDEKATLSQIEKLELQFEQAYLQLREIYATYIYRYTWRPAGHWFVDSKGERHYPRADQIRVSKTRYEKTVSLLRSVDAKMVKRRKLLQKLKDAYELQDSRSA